jgi:hypothetical protein
MPLVQHKEGKRMDIPSFRNLIHFIITEQTKTQIPSCFKYFYVVSPCGRKFMFYAEFYLLGYNTTKQLLHTGFLPGFIFNPKDGGKIFLLSTG